MKPEELDQYLGYDPANENVTGPIFLREYLAIRLGGVEERHINQRDADLVHYWHRVLPYDLAQHSTAMQKSVKLFIGL